MLWKQFLSFHDPGHLKQGNSQQNTEMERVKILPEKLWLDWFVSTLGVRPCEHHPIIPCPSSKRGPRRCVRPALELRSRAEPPNGAAWGSRTAVRRRGRNAPGADR